MSQTKAQLISDLVQALAFTATASAPTNGIFLSASNTLAISTNSAQRLTVDSSGNVGIATSSISGANLVIATNSNSGSGIKLIGKSANGGAEIDFRNNADSTLNGFIEFNDNGGTLSTVVNQPQVFRTNNTERMRITSTGLIDVSGGIQVSENVTPTSGSGVEIFKASASSGQVSAYNRDSSAWMDLILKGNNLQVFTNGSENLRINSSGNVGIGTTSPSNLLHLNSSDTAAIRFDRGGTKQLNIGTDSSQSFIASFESKPLAFATSTSSAYTERMRIDSSGRVLIGTTTEGNAEADNLTIAGSGNTGITIRSGNSNVGAIYFADGTSGSENYQGIVQYGHNSNSLQFYANYAGSSNPRMVIDSSGRVGIGTSSPNRKLQVAGQTAITNSDDSGAFLFDPAGSINTFLSRAGQASTTALPLAVKMGNTERLRIDSSGRLLVGTSSSYGIADTVQIVSDTGINLHRGSANTGAARLDLSKSRNTAYGSNTIVQSGDTLGSIVFRGDDGTDYTTPGGEIKVEVDGTPGANDMPGRLVFSTTADGASSTTEHFRIDSAGQLLASNYKSNGVLTIGYDANGNNAANDYIAFVRGASTEMMRLDGSGRLGIGTSSPGSYNGAADNLVIYDSTNAGITIRSGTNSDGGIYFNDTDDGNQRGIVRYNHQTDALAFHTPAGESMRIDSSGNAGIGTSNPNRQLHVADSRTSIATVAFEATNGSATGGAVIFANYYAANNSAIKFIQFNADQGGTPEEVFRVNGVGNVANKNNSYGSLSDAKLKENIIDSTSQWDDIKGIRVRKYNFIGEQDHTQIGVVAQEVETVSPGLVEDTPDTDDDGNDLGTVTKSVNYSVLYMKAVKALQEAMERIETLETKVAALEAG